LKKSEEQQKPAEMTVKDTAPLPTSSESQPPASKSTCGVDAETNKDRDMPAKGVEPAKIFDANSLSKSEEDFSQMDAWLSEVAIRMEREISKPPPVHNKQTVVERSHNDIGSTRVHEEPSVTREAAYQPGPRNNLIEHGKISHTAPLLLKDVVSPSPVLKDTPSIAPAQPPVTPSTMPVVGEHARPSSPNRQVVITAEARRMPQQISQHTGTTRPVVGEELSPSRITYRNLDSKGVGSNMQVQAKIRVPQDNTQQISKPMTSASSASGVGTAAVQSPESHQVAERETAVSIKSVAPSVFHDAMPRSGSPQHVAIENKVIISPRQSPRLSSDGQSHSTSSGQMMLNQNLGEEHTMAYAEPKPPLDPKPPEGPSASSFSGRRVQKAGNDQTDMLWHELTQQIDEGTSALQEMADKLKAENTRLHAAS